VNSRVRRYRSLVILDGVLFSKKGMVVALRGVFSIIIRRGSNGGIVGVMKT